LACPENDIYYKKIPLFMRISTKSNFISRALAGLALLLLVGAYSCNNNAPATEAKKDTAAAAPMDTSAKMAMDSGKAKMDSTAKMPSDTAHKGGQTPPPKN
jgi:hypothetical protein